MTKRMLWMVAVLSLVGCFDWSAFQKRGPAGEPYLLKSLPLTEDILGSHTETSHFMLAAGVSITVEAQAVLPPPPKPPDGTPKPRHPSRKPPPPPRCGSVYGVELVRARDDEVIAPTTYALGSSPAASSWSAPEEGEYYVVVGAQDERCELEGTVKVYLAP